MHGRYAVVLVTSRPAWQLGHGAHIHSDGRKTITLSLLLRCTCRLEEDEHLVLTPFEKNLEVWRQLWRVLERSDVIVQVRRQWTPVC